MLISGMGQRACHLPLSLYHRPIHSLRKDVTMHPLDCWMCKTLNRWHSVDPHINRTETLFVNSIILRNESFIHYWHRKLCFYVLSYAACMFVISPFLINWYPQYLSDGWGGPITFLFIRLEIHGKQTILFVFGTYRSTSTPFLVPLLHLNFHDVPWPISNISTMSTRSVQRVIQLDEGMKAAWWSSLRQIRIEH